MVHDVFLLYMPTVGDDESCNEDGSEPCDSANGRDDELPSTVDDQTGFLQQS